MACKESADVKIVRVPFFELLVSFAPINIAKEEIKIAAVKADPHKDFR